MATTNHKAYKMTYAIVQNGVDVGDACARTGVTRQGFSAWLRHNKKGLTTTTTAADTPHGDAPLEEQIISSNLSPKAKVKILSTMLLNN